MRNNIKRILSLTLVMVMMLAVMPVALAAVDISLAGVSSSHTFSNALVGYDSTAQTALAVVITNGSSTDATGTLTIALGGTNSSSFEISKTTITDISANGTDSFTVKPAASLQAGTYTATVTVSGSGLNASKTFDVSFTVEAVNKSIALKESGNAITALDFGSATAGYTQPNAKTVTVENNGNVETGALIVSLSEASSNFTLTGASISSIAVAGFATFTVVPNANLPAGTYEETVTVTNSNGITKTFTVKFVVTTAVTTVTITPTSGLSKTYGASDPTLTYASSVSGLGFTGSLNRATGENAGTYAIGLGTLSATGYTLSLSGTTVYFTITRAASSATVSTPTVNTKTSSTISVNSLTSSNTTTNPTVEYAITTSSSSTAPTSGWQISTSFSSLSASTTYYVWARAKESTNYNAGDTVRSAAITTTSATTFTTAPKSLSATTTSGKVYLTWTASSPAADQYNVYYGTSTSNMKKYDDTTSRSMTVSGLTNGTKYYFYVVAVKSGYTNSETSTINITVNGTDNTDEFHVATSTSSKSSSAITSYTFSSKGAGYDDLDPTTFYVHSDGSKLTSVSVALSGDNKSSFTLTKMSSSTIAKNEYETFTVVPKTGLKKGTYEATVTVTDSNDEEYAVDLTFVVKAGDDMYFTEKSSGSAFSTFTFNNENEGYAAPSAQTLYVYNDSGSSLKSVTLSLTGTNKDSFTLSTTSLGTISDGKSASFTIVPKTNLAAGTYTAKLTAEASNNSSATVTLNFTVKAGAADAVTNPFSDIATSAWYYNDVLKAYQQGLIDGFTANQFKPDNNLTVAQAIKLAACVHQRYYNGSVTLTNGSPNWYDSYVTYAKNNGIISGDYVDYSAAITREEFVNIFYNALPASDYTILKTLADTYIPDVQPGATYYSKIFRFYQAGILTGSDTAGTFNPKTNIKRSEVAAILTRLYDSSERIG